MMEFTILGYQIGYPEFFGTILGFAATVFASRAHILTWLSALLSSVFLFILFWDIKLYANLILQVYFFSISVYGWIKWRKTADTNKITELNLKNRLLTTAILALATLLTGWFMSNIHLIFPALFDSPSASPYADSFILVTSIVANYFLAIKKIENWYLWFINDAVCVFLFYQQGVYFLMLEYLLFLGIAIYGIVSWKKLQTSQS